ncbi:MAG: signal transduction histidine kinase [Candidatus Omnitrophota bacterium]|jgi:signal transduction histidine kinase
MISSWTLAYIVFKHSQPHSASRLWAYFSILVGIWGLGITGGTLSPTPETALLWWKFGNLGVTLMPGMFIHFTYSYLGITRRRVVTLGYAYSIFFLINIFFPFFIVKSVWVFDSYYHFGRPMTPMYLFFTITWLSIIIYCHIEFLLALPKHKGEKRTQIIYFLLATIIGFVGGSLTYLVAMNTSYYPWGNFCVPLYPIVMGYAIVVHKLMDVKVVISKALFYSIFAFGVSFTYLCSASFIQMLFPIEFRSNLMLNITILGLILIALKPIESLLNKYLQKKFFRGTISQISQQNEHLESELERNQRLKSVGILAAGMAHEIRNPIQSLKTFGEYLDKKYDDKEYRTKFQSLIAKESTRIEKLTTDLLDFSKPKEPNRQKTNLGMIINEVIELVFNQLMKQQITTKLNMPQTSIYATVDSDQIKQALLNLIINAKDAMQDSATKELTITLKEGVIAIQDTGCGISSDKIPHLFDPFYTNKEKGTGLGLAITHTLIEKNDGSVVVSSRVGVGTSFMIHWNGDL